MKFVVRPKVEREKLITMCAQCKEDPRFCEISPI